MDKILEKVDFENNTVYEIKVSVEDSSAFENSTEDDTQDIDGQAMDPVSRVRRTIKYSYPLENKKIIKSIDVSEETEDKDLTLCRNISVHYYLLVDSQEVDEFSRDELHDELEEEWRDGSADCEIEIEAITP